MTDTQTHTNSRDRFYKTCVGQHFENHKPPSDMYIKTLDAVGHLILFHVSDSYRTLVSGYPPTWDLCSKQIHFVTSLRHGGESLRPTVFMLSRCIVCKHSCGAIPEYIFWIQLPSSHSWSVHSEVAASI